MPHLKVVGDHSSGPIVELATGPLPITEAGREEHRLVVESWDSKLNAWNDQKAADAQVPKALKDVNDAFNADLKDATQDKAPTKYTLGQYDTSQAWAVKRRVHPVPNRKQNNIQVNFEVSLCAFYSNQNYAALTHDKNIQLLDAAAKAAVAKWMAAGLPGVTAQEVG